jgi:Tol biopolymer transport system component
VPLTPRTFELLVALVERAGDVLDKNELIRRVWGATIVEENNLARQISSLRKALGETAGQREYVATVPGVGYRFVAPVVASDEPLPLPPLPPESQTPPTIWMTPRVLAGASLLVLVAVAVGGLLSRTRILNSAPQRSMQQFTFGGGLHHDPAWSPDGRAIAFASDRVGVTNIWVQKIDGSEPVRVTTSPDRDSQPDWSPDGRLLTYKSEASGGGIFVVPIEGGQPRRVSSFGDRPRWSPTGDWILFSNATVRTGARRLFVVAAAGGEPREIAADAIRPMIAPTWLHSVDASWYPDGQRISIWGRTDGRWTFVTVPLFGGAPVYSQIPEAVLQEMENTSLTLGKFVWAGSRKFVYFEGQSGDTRNVWRVGIKPASLAWTGAPERLTVDVGQETDIKLSSDGTRLAFTVRNPRTRVWSIPFDSSLGRMTGDADALTASSTGEVGVDTLPDGSRLAYRSLRPGRSEVREFRTSSQEDRILLVSNEWTPSSPRWSTDGRRLAYSRAEASGARPPRHMVALYTPDEQHEQLLTLPGSSWFRPSDWSRDGATILGDCREAPADVTRVCTIPAPEIASNSTRPITLLRDATRHLYGPRFSPDQRWVSFVAVAATGATTTQLYAAPVDGGPWVPITDGQSFDDKPRWSPDGRAIYFVSDRNGFLNVSGRRFDPSDGRAVGEPFPVTTFNNAGRGLPASISQIEFAVTRKNLFVPLTETDADVWVLDRVDQ